MKKIFGIVLLLIVAVMMFTTNISFAATDTTKPVITVSPTSGSTVDLGATVYITINDPESKIVSASYNLNGIAQNITKAANNNWIIELTNFNIAGKTYELVVNATNEAGLTVKKNFTYYTKAIDVTKPVITSNPASGSTIKLGSTVVISVSDSESEITSVTYDCNGIKGEGKGSGKKWTVNLTNFNIPGKEYELIVTATNESKLTRKTTFVYYTEELPVEEEKDTTKPVITSSLKEYSTIYIEDNQEVVITINDPESEIVSASYDLEGIYEKIDKAPNHTWKMYIKGFNREKTFDLTIVAKNEAGLEATETFTYYVKAREVEEEKDTTKPVITSSLKEYSTIYIEDNQEVVITINDPESKIVSASYDLEGIYEKYDKAPNHTWKMYIKGFNREKTFDLTIVAKNEVGLESTETFTYYVKAKEAPKDNVAPSISVDPANKSTVEGGKVVKVTLRDDVELKKVEYYWKGDTAQIKNITGTSETVDMPAIEDKEGTYYLYVKVTDASGNTTEGTYTYYVKAKEVPKDNTDPTISVNPVNKSTVVGGKVIRATLRDDVELKKVEYYWKGDAAQTKNISGTQETVDMPAIDDEEDTYYLYIKVTDASGNTAEGTYTYYVEEDDEGDIPEVDADPSKGTLEFGDKITITADDDDGIDYVEYYWDDKDDKEKKYDDEFTVRVPSETGKHYLYVRAVDEKGNKCDYEKFTYTIEEDNYPGNPDVMGDINKNVKELRVEIRNGDDKIKFKPEEEILYYVDYYNGSSSKISNAKIVVDLPTYLKGLEASDDGKVTSTKITWNLGTLDKGEYGRLSFTAEYTNDNYNEKIITVPAKIYSGSSLKDTSTVRNLIYSDDGKGTGSHEAYCIGYPSGTFRPNGNITRAELATMISNIEGITSTYRGGFLDVDGHWAANNIQACLERGYIKSLGYNTFGAEQYATRADLAYAIAAILEVEDLEPVFVHSSDLKYSDARCAMEQLLRLGIMDGYSDGTSKPDKNVTRAEAVTIINNYLFRGELYTNGYKYSYNYENNYNYGGDYYILKFTDLTVNHWAYGHIMEATNSHRYVRCLDGNEEML